MKATFYNCTWSGFVILILLLVVSIPTFSQHNTKQQVLDHRLFVKTSIENGEFSMVNPHHRIMKKYVFQPIEQELMFLLIGDFQNFYKQAHYNYGLTRIYDFKRYYSDEEFVPQINNYFFVGDHPNAPFFHDFLVDEVLKKREQIIEQLKEIDDFEHHKDFVLLYLDYLSFTSTDKLDNDEQLKLLDHGGRYLKKYPCSQFSQFVHRAMDEFIEPSWFGFDMNFSFGHTSFNGLSRDYFSPQFDFGSDLRFYVHNMFLGMRASYSSSISLAEFTMNDRYVPPRKELYFYQYDLYLGRDFQLSKRFSFLPFGGISMTRFAVRYPSNDGGECPKVDVEKNRVTGMFYGFEAQYHVRKVDKQKTHFSKYKRNLGLYKPYLSFGFNHYMLDYTVIQERISGDNLTFRFGFGWFVRAEKRTMINPKSL